MVVAMWKIDSGGTHRNEIKSLSLANVMTLFASSFGTGNSACKIPLTLSPRRVENPSKIRWGYCSDTVELALDDTSWRSTTLWSVMEIVGPWGRCETMSASGTPRCSWIITRSVIPWAWHAGTRSRMTVLPRFSRWELGKTRRSS
jgi:hypothetical protein